MTSVAAHRVRAETLTCAEGLIGMLTLDRPSQCNALSLEMIHTLQQQLDAWQADDQVALVLVAASGEKAFCAGGDIHEIASYAHPDLPLDTSATFFAAEYRLDYALHRYPKPLVCWGQGSILGGGMGLLQGARYRLGTADAQMGMPEISIGLVPDAGASWFLNRLPEGFGRFLGLTGALLDSADALRLGLLDHVVPQEALGALLDRLQSARWGSTVAANDNRLYRLLQQFAQDRPCSLPAGHLAQHEQTITRLCQDRDVARVTRDLLRSELSSAWWQKAQTNLAEGCPTAGHLFFALLEHSRQMTFGDIFRMELGVATRCIRTTDFAEGLRSRVTEAGGRPQWQFNGMDEVPADYVEAFFLSPWEPENHPLRDL